MSRVTMANELVAELDAVGLFATLDLAEAAANAPAVLIPPPVVEPGTMVGWTVTWSLVLVASSTVGSAEAWAELDAMLDTILDTFPVERAAPSSYALPDGASHPAYTITLTETE